MSRLEANLPKDPGASDEQLIPEFDWPDVDDYRYLHAKIQPSGRVDIKQRSKYKEVYPSVPAVRRDTQWRIYKSRKTAKPGHGQAKHTEHPYHGYRAVFETITAMQFVRGKENIFYLVLTFPGNTRNAQYAVECWSGEIVEQLGNFIRKEIPLPEYVWTYEYQGRGFLHLNAVMYIPKYLQSKMTKDFMQSNLRRILISVSDKAEYDLFERDDGLSYKGEIGYPITSFEPCRKDLAHYVAKNKTKIPRTGDKTGSFVSPCRWYGCSKAATFLRTINTSEFEFDHEAQTASSLIKSFQTKGRSKAIVNPYNYETIGRTAQAKNKKAAERSLSKFVSTSSKVSPTGSLALRYINSGRVLESRDRILEIWHQHCISRLFPCSLNKFSKAAKADKRTVEKVLRSAGLWNIWLKKNRIATS